MYIPKSGLKISITDLSKFEAHKIIPLDINPT
jgi:hypothetical protein